MRQVGAWVHYKYMQTLRKHLEFDTLFIEKPLKKTDLADTHFVQVQS